MGLGVPVGSPELTLGPLQTSQLLAAVSSPEHHPSEDSQPGIVALKKKEWGGGTANRRTYILQKIHKAKQRKGKNVRWLPILTAYKLT